MTATSGSSAADGYQLGKSANTTPTSGIENAGEREREREHIPGLRYLKSKMRKGSASTQGPDSVAGVGNVAPASKVL